MSLPKTDCYWWGVANECIVKNPGGCEICERYQRCYMPEPLKSSGGGTDA
ncbi:MAG: hypothetical protein DDT35_00417 [Firmicutes bacterium]|nr:hypothetical protein [Bacillota bacterium]